MNSLAIAGSSRSRSESNGTKDWRENVMSSLKAHAALSEDGIRCLEEALVASSYVESHGTPPSGLACGPGIKYYKPDGSEYTLRDVPLRAILAIVRNRINNNRGNIIPRNRRKEIFDKVMAALPEEHRSKVIWEDGPAPLDPNAEPVTPFSAPRTQSGEEKSNAALMDDLARAAGLDSGTKRSISAQITWTDGCADGKASCMLTGGTWEVKGGRLKRDHTLEDVPTCYVRDRIMDYINKLVPEEKKMAARRAVFSDLNDDEINAYSAMIAEEAAVAENESMGVLPAQSKSQPQDPEKLLCDIDDTVDLTPHAEPVVRQKPRRKPILHSVVWPPHFKQNPLPVERLVKVEGGIHHDCDQIRAMIKRFVEGGTWSIDGFRLALTTAAGEVSIEQFNTFLRHKGPRNGIRCKAFDLCWEFFYRREKLSLPLTGADPCTDEDLLEERAKKRPNTASDAGESRGGKRPRG
ncbi:hypothetical protein VTI28DRAFT_5974 [Corynascus sepedonium]